jgi:hypothetical protein
MPLRKTTAKKIVEIVGTQVFLTQGVPEIIIADNGSQFVSKEFNWPNTMFQNFEKIRYTIHKKSRQNAPTTQSKQL